jgi:pimeloyl-ACP methyl ester carboxylesterase
LSFVLLRHNRVSLALHTLRAQPGPALLLLHALGERSPARVPAELARWPGPIFALDFTGHGESTIPAGGGYTAEVLMADADAAVAQLGRVSVLGRGLGAYVALMIAGGRPKLVAGAILCDGPGLVGGTPEPGAPEISLPAAGVSAGPPDPFALVELARDVRPPDYASSFVRQARELSGLERPISVCARERPPWLAAVLAEPGVAPSQLDAALAYHARAAVGGQ